MAIQSDETLVTKGDLKTLYTDKILPYLGGNMMMQTGVSDYYSEDEKVVGVWIDGRPIYQISISGNLGNSSGQGSNGDLFVSLPTGTNSDLQIGFQGYVYNKTSSGSIGISPCHTYVNSIGHISGNLVPSWSATNGDTVLIRNSMPAFNGWPFIATIRYTKTTDTASSALTTPGCYDINRPDLWPNGQEIFFGNGLYGMRKAGTATANNLQSGIVLVSNVSKTACCYNKGGMIDMSGTNGTNWYDINGGWDNKGAQRQFNPLITNTSQTFRFYCQDNQNYTTQNIQYNIWFTYTK